MTVLFALFIIILLKIIKGAIVIENHKLKNSTPPPKGEETPTGEEIPTGEETPTGEEYHWSGGYPDKSLIEPSREREETRTEEDYYWSGGDPDKSFTLPSPVRLVDSPAGYFAIRSCFGDAIEVISANGTLTRISFINKSHPIDGEEGDPRLYRIYLFDLKYFELGDEDKKLDPMERTKRYMVFENTYSNMFLHTDMDTDFPEYAVELTNKRPAIGDTMFTDDRFFEVEYASEKDGKRCYSLKNMVSDYILYVGSGVVVPQPRLKHMQSAPSYKELFFIEKINPDAS